MRVFEFKCDQCGKLREFVTPIVETLCNCGGVLKRKYSIGGVKFKGTGFYSNDKNGS